MAFISSRAYSESLEAPASPRAKVGSASRSLACAGFEPPAAHRLMAPGLVSLSGMVLRVSRTVLHGSLHWCHLVHCTPGVGVCSKCVPPGDSGACILLLPAGSLC